MKKVKISFFNNLPVWLRRTIAGVLIAALIGGGVYGILLLVRGSGGKVKVYPIMEFCTDYADDQAETQGLVKPDKMQSIYVSETQKITKYFVREGDTVKVGDPILSYDTTLTDLQLERARISVQKLEIALDEANANLVKVNNYRLYVPQPDPLPDEEPDTPLTPVEVPYFRGGSGTKDSPFFYIWSNNCAYDSAFIDSLLTTDALMTERRRTTAAISTTAATPISIRRRATPIMSSSPCAAKRRRRSTRRSSISKRRGSNTKRSNLRSTTAWSTARSTA